MKNLRVNIRRVHLHFGACYSDWDALDEVVHVRHQMAQVSVTLSTESARINEADKYEQAMGETQQTFVITGLEDKNITK